MPYEQSVLKYLTTNKPLLSLTLLLQEKNTPEWDRKTKKKGREEQKSVNAMSSCNAVVFLR